MNKPIVAGLATAIALSSLSLSPVQANENVKFICNVARIDGNSVPTTYAWYGGGKRPLIRWQKSLGSRTPQERCEQISPRFQQAYDNGSINIITNGRMNGQPVICTAKAYGGSCHTLLMTLRPTDDSLAVLNDLKDVLSGRSLGPVKHSSGTPQVYYQIDIKETLRTTPIEQE